MCINNNRRSLIFISYFWIIFLLYFLKKEQVSRRSCRGARYSIYEWNMIIIGYLYIWAIFGIIITLITKQKWNFVTIYIYIFVSNAKANYDHHFFHSQLNFFQPIFFSFLTLFGNFLELNTSFFWYCNDFSYYGIGLEGV